MHIKRKILSLEYSLVINFHIMCPLFMRSYDLNPESKYTEFMLQYPLHFRFHLASISVQTSTCTFLIWIEFMNSGTIRFLCFF